MIWKHKMTVLGSFVALAACNGSNGSAVAHRDVGVSALAETIADCQAEQTSCVEQASSPQQVAECNSALTECLLVAAPTRREVAQSYNDCQIQLRECLAQSGTMGPASCRTDFDTCVASIAEGSEASDAGMPDRPGLPRLDAGLPELPRPGGRLPPGLPGAGAGGGLPVPGGPIIERERAGYECLSMMRECVVAGMSTPMECADQARSCLANPAPTTAGAAAPTP